MTIKRRLFLSNILMILIPLILSMAVAFTTLFVFDSLTRSTERRAFRGRAPFFQVREEIRPLVRKWSHNQDIAEMMRDVRNFNSRYIGEGPMLFIYREGIPVTPEIFPETRSPLDLALSQADPYTIMNWTSIYTEHVGEYQIVLMDTRFFMDDLDEYKKTITILSILIFICIIVIILLTNRFLTRFVFRKIAMSLDILIHGVLQIRDGNLNYRIEYEGQDEFAGLCVDFNEMAERLLASVNARQKDDSNRRELIAGISHDLRTPLTSIKAYTEGLESGLDSTAETRKRYIETIKTKTKDLEQIIDMLFLFSKLDIGEFPSHLEPISLGNELERIVSSLKEEYDGKGLDIALKKEGEDACASVDVAQLRMALLNILENSVKYKDKERGKMEIALSSKDGYATVTLSDDGPGAPEEALEKLFDVFYRGDPSRSNPSKGSGLGLAITAKIVERFGGTIKAVNNPERGLSTIIRLPEMER